MELRLDILFKRVLARWIDINSGHNLNAGLLHPIRQSAGTTEQINRR